VRADGIDREIGPGPLGDLVDGRAQVVRRDDGLRDLPQGLVARDDRLADDDAARARRAQDLRRERADRAPAEHDRRGRELLGDEGERMHAGGERLGQDRDLRGRVVGQAVDAAHRHGHELREATGARAADQAAPGAGVLQARAAAQAVAAGDLRVDRHAQAFQVLARRPAGGHDTAGQLVPHDQRRRAPRRARGDAVDVGGADARRLHPQQDLVRRGGRRGDVAHLEVVRLRVQQSVHPAGSSSQRPWLA
jgi:hypothetical protein